MRICRGAVSTLLVSGLVLLVASPVSATDLIELGTLPGLTQPQARIGTAIDFICPKLAAKAPSLNSAQTDLLGRCSDMKLPGQLGLGLSSQGLAGVLTDQTSEQTSSQGTGAIEARAPQLRAVAARLSALRLGATGLGLSGLKLDLDGKTVSAAELPGLGERGGGASADRASLGGLGAFVNGVGGFGSKDTTANEIGFNYHNAGVTAGVDYRITDSLVAGLAFSWLRTDADMNFALGEASSNSYGVSLYGTYYIRQAYVDVMTGFTWYNYDTTRRIVYAPAPGAAGQAVDRTATGSTDGFQFTFNTGVGYDFSLGAWTLTPYGRVEYLHLSIDGYNESGADGLNLQIKDQTVQSLLTVLGGRVAHAFGTPVGVLVPQVRGEWRHESLNGSRSINAQFLNDPFNQSFSIPTDNPDRDFFAVGTGVSAVFKKGLAAFLDFETVLGLSNITSYNFTAGVRIEF